jgi:hypothetical protein
VTGHVDIAGSRKMSLKNIVRVCGTALAVGALSLTGTTSALAHVQKRADSLKVALDGVDPYPGGDDPCQEWVLASSGGIVSVELDYAGYKKGMLRARSSSIGPWEKLRICRHENFQTIFSVAAQRYVSVELDYGGADEGMLRARSTSVGAWEKFAITCAATCTIKSLANGRYVSAELAYTGSGYGMLRARADKAGAWEIFQPR